MQSTGPLPQKRMLLIAALQGIALLYLKTAAEAGSWPSESPLWSFPLWTLTLAVPTLLMLAMDGANIRRLLPLVGAFAALLTLVAVYTGYQARPFGAFPISGFAWVFGASIALACFKALMYLQQRAAGAPLSYAVLFSYSWRNALTLTLAWLLTFVFWLILKLWGSLFDTIGIEFFKTLFDQDWFVIPILAIAHGVGIVIFRNLTQVIDSITHVLRGLIKLLLPLVVIVAVIFVGTLPFAGLDALWQTGRGTSLLLWLFALVLFFVNAVYQDGSDSPPYPLALHRMLYAGLCVTPLLSALSCYGLWLRVEQYGWSVARSWAFVVWGLLTLFAIGYVVGILRRRDRWTEDLARVNTGMGLIVLTIMLLANSPLLDFRKISLDSQLGRLDSGAVELADFDFWYAHRVLARPGYIALEAFKEQVGDDNPELLALIENPRRRRAIDQNEPRETEFWANLTYRPADFAVPDELRSDIAARRPVDASIESLLLRVNLDAEGADEYVLVNIIDGRAPYATLFYRTGDDWNNTSMSIHNEVGGRRHTVDDVKHGELTVRQPRYNDLALGDTVYRMTYPRILPGQVDDATAE